MIETAPSQTLSAQKISALPAEIAKLSFEDAMSELERLVRQLEEGKAKLEDAISAYERGAFLKRHCETKLREAKAKIDRIEIGPDGEASLTSLNS